MLDYLRKHTPMFTSRKSILIILLSIALAVSAVEFRSTLFIILLLVLAIASKLPEILYRSINSDMTMFMLIVLGRIYGAPFGFFVALTGFYAALALKTVIAKHIAPEKLIVPPIGYLIAGTIALSMGYNIFITGMIAVAIYSSIMLVAYGFIYGFQVFDEIIYVVTIFGFNYFIFSNFAPFVMAVLKV